MGKLKDNSVRHADDEMTHIQELGKYLPDDYREYIMNIIRLSLIEAYRKGWNDSEQNDSLIDDKEKIARIHEQLTKMNELIVIPGR